MEDLHLDNSPNTPSIPSIEGGKDWNMARFTPFIQAAIALVLSLVFNAIAYVAYISHLVHVEREVFWVFSTAFVLLFIVFNTTVGMAINNSRNYFRDSLYSFVAMIAVSNGLAYLLSGVSVYRVSGSFAWIYLVLIICYLCLVAITGLIRALFQFMAREHEHITGEAADLDKIWKSDKE